MSRSGSTAANAACVEVLLLLARLTADHPPGILVHVTTDDPAAPLDLPAW